MTSILPQPERVYLSEQPNGPESKRKLGFRWELAKVGGHFVVVNTQLANKVALRLLCDHEGLRERLGLTGTCQVRPEVSVPGEKGKKTRFDFGFTHTERPDSFLEVKQVSLRISGEEEQRWAAFPDAVTARGRKHLLALKALRDLGGRTFLLYVVGRNDVDAVRPAHEVDPAYAETFFEAVKAGVEVIACTLQVDTQRITLGRFIPVQASSDTAPALHSFTSESR
jgi:sugar fermentation stimulation protein A